MTELFKKAQPKQQGAQSWGFNVQILCREVAPKNNAEHNATGYRRTVGHRDDAHSHKVTTFFPVDLSNHGGGSCTRTAGRLRACTATTRACRRRWRRPEKCTRTRRAAHPSVAPRMRHRPRQQLAPPDAFIRKFYTQTVGGRDATQRVPSTHDVAAIPGPQLKTAFPKAQP